ncbi:MAG: hypothetical protein V1797_06725 [Pseudomonadota bacterium]
MANRRQRTSGLGAAAGCNEAEAMERLEQIDQTLATAYAQALPSLRAFESRHRELTAIIHRARQAPIDWEHWAFSTLGYRPREGGFFHSTEAGTIVDALEHAVWALRRTDTEKWKWFGVALFGAVYGMLVEVLCAAGREVGGGGEDKVIPYADALGLMLTPGLAPGPAGATPWLGADADQRAANQKALVDLEDFYRNRFMHIRPASAPPFRIAEFIDRVGQRAVRALAVLALEHHPAWTPGQRLRMLAGLSRLADLLLIEYGRLQGELMQLLCRAHYAGVPLMKSRKR